jgi:hypothetical protein
MQRSTKIRFARFGSILIGLFAVAGIGAYRSRPSLAPRAIEVTPGEPTSVVRAHAPIGGAVRAAPEPTDTTSEPPAGSSEQEGAAELSKAVANVTAPLHDRWEQEPKDARWRDLEREIAQFFQDPRLSGLEFVSVDCRTTLCRYEVALADQEALHNMLRVATEVRPFDGALGLPTMQGNHMAVYLAPPGVSLFPGGPSQEARQKLMSRFTAPHS